jgi:hypothetical protein
MLSASKRYQEDYAEVFHYTKQKRNYISKDYFTAEVNLRALHFFLGAWPVVDFWCTAMGVAI